METTGNGFERLNRFKKTSKPLFFSILLIFSIQTSSLAQNSNAQDFLVLYSGDTLYGSVEHINLKGVSPKFYKKIRLTDTRGKQKKLRRKEVAAFQVNGEMYESFWLSQSSEKIILINPKYDINPRSGQQYFLKLINKGKLSHYQLEWWEQGESTLMWMDLLRKEEDQYLIRATQGLFGLKTNVLMNYFTNCPDLKEQIEQGQFNEVYQIIDFYNRNCID